MSDLELNNWINNEFLSMVLDSYVGTKIKVLNYEISPAAKKGENFASTIYRIKITYEIKPNESQLISLILKTNSTDDAIQEIIEEFQVFDRETTTYNEVLIACEKLLQNIGDTLNFSPQLIYASSNVLVLEDVSVKGYSTMDRKQGLDLLHAKLFIQKLAKFHAATTILYKKVNYL